jgi:dihydrofolate synthase/folylpolyglutamate synthase
VSLTTFLETKPLFYDKIDLSRMPNAYQRVAPHLRLGRVVHLVGTNGKGSTGRIIAELLLRAGYRVGHYSSPHILHFNERIWIDGADATDELLEIAHQKLMGWLGQEIADSLSYFEYTTLLALVAFEDTDFIVLEAGLGGEFDATNVVDKVLSIITPIGIDHQAFLGDTIQEIATTKLRSIQKEAIVAKQSYEEVYRVAKEIAKQKGATLYTPDMILDDVMQKEIKKTALQKGWADYLGENAITAFATVKHLTGITFEPKELETIQIKGRFEEIAPNVILDVGHNPLGAEAIARAFNGHKRVLVYNVLSDKDVIEILTILKPVIERLEIIPIQDERAMPHEELVKAAQTVGLKALPFKGVSKEENYLVFGSFMVAEAFLRRYCER